MANKVGTVVIPPNKSWTVPRDLTIVAAVMLCGTSDDAAIVIGAGVVMPTADKVVDDFSVILFCPAHDGTENKIINIGCQIPVKEGSIIKTLGALTWANVCCAFV